MYSQEGQYAESLPYYRQAFAQDPGFAGLAPNYSQALVARAAEERRAGRALVAKALLQEALAVNPGDAEARRQLEALLAEPGGVDTGSGGAARRTVDDPRKPAIMAPLATWPTRSEEETE